MSGLGVPGRAGGVTGVSVAGLLRLEAGVADVEVSASREDVDGVSISSRDRFLLGA